MDLYCHAKRSDIGNAKEYWKSFWDKLVDEAKGLYIKEEEMRSAFVDKTITTYEKAFEHLENIKYDAGNAFLVKKIKSYLRKEEKEESPS